MYDEFAKIYDSLMTEVDYDQWADYLFRHLLNGKRDTKKILEFGCGTGSITTRLARKGYAMTGVDLSEEMLTELLPKCETSQDKHLCFLCGHLVFGKVRSVTKAKKK